MTSKLKLPRTVTPSRRTKSLRFSPYAWAKLLYLRDRGDTEVGAFGISSELDLLRLEDLVVLRQSCTEVTVAFHDESVADFFDQQIDAGRRPAEFGRIWVHTHPGTSARPSGTDEATFARVFGRSEWAVMFILAEEGATYARLRFNSGPGGEVELPVEVDFTAAFRGSDVELWEAEYQQQVQVLDDPWSRAERLTGAAREDILATDAQLDAWLEDMHQHFREAEHAHLRRTL